MQGRRSLITRGLRSSDLWRDAAAIALFVAGLLFLWSALSILPDGRGWGYDYSAYHGAAERIVANGSPYQVETLAGPFHPGPGGLYLYSPIPALALVPLTWLGEQSATWAFAFGHIGLLIGAGLLLPMSRRLRLAVIGVAGLSLAVITDVQLGNISLVVTSLTMIAWRFLDRPAGSIAIAVSITMRPTMGLFLAWWAVRRRWRALVWAISAGVAMAIVSLPFVGVGSYLEFLSVLRNLSSVTGAPNNVDLATSALALGLPEWAATGALLLSYAIALGAIVLSLRRDRELSFVVVSMATLFLSPLLWDHYLTQLLIPGAFLAKRGHTWGLLLPLLAWLPVLDLKPLLAIAGIAGMLLPLVARESGEPAWPARDGSALLEADDVAVL